MGGGMGGSKESAPGKNPFELLKEVIENNSTGHKEVKVEKVEEKITSSTKIIFPFDIEGAKEILVDPLLKKFDKNHSKSIRFYSLIKGQYIEKLMEWARAAPGTIEKQLEKDICDDKSIDTQSQSDKDYKKNTTYIFITKLNRNFIFTM